MNQPQTNYAFIDSQNLNLGVQKMGWKMDWRKFRAYLRDTYGVEKAFMFIGYMPNYEDLYQQMHDAGYLVVLKPTLEMFHTVIEGADAPPLPPPGELVKQNKQNSEDKKPAVKGNVDAELVLYAVKEIPNYKQAIIVSGDGDFYSLVEYLEQQGKLLHLLAPNWQYSSLLKPYEKYIVRIDQLRRELAYHDFKKKKPSGR